MPKWNIITVAFRTTLVALVTCSCTLETPSFTKMSFNQGIDPEIKQETGQTLKYIFTDLRNGSSGSLWAKCSEPFRLQLGKEENVRSLVEKTPRGRSEAEAGSRKSERRSERICSNAQRSFEKCTRLFL